jgi:copper oxidase (laccase) domain-containing protein
MSYHEFAQHLGSFDHLSELGVTNFFTNSNSYWGDMKRLSPGAVEHFQQIFNAKDIDATKILAMGAEHNDNIRVIDHQNYKVYWEMNAEKDSSPAMRLWCDSFITKESIPMIVSPADCCVIVITGIDKADGKRFIALVHAGFIGALLNIVSKTVERIQSIYSCDRGDFRAFMFPYVNGDRFIKTPQDTRVILAQSLPEWSDFLRDAESGISVSFGKKVERELEILGIPFETTGIDTFEANKNGYLYSESYLKSTNDDRTKRFGVGICLALPNSLEDKS